ncbi:DUF4357 domain-containing protein [Hoyosella rhizosphaerae]|uniref:DUF4357 domain-containing protein n=1 Tax=Hoyosella rhizosphaerae TaxID=1755582 RepID=A0A916XIW9_9ACTN|nr:DUF4357 domain-containing protein [Hoyosella rhizosphaerae]GGC73806.1 hypothetical protein GCM10011410_28710 [Hoyosella rhizosphaerae]
MRGETTPSAGRTVRSLIDILCKNGVIAVDRESGLGRFTRDHTFPSATTSATVITGTSVNGSAAWKVQGTQVTYGQWSQR